MSIVFFWSQIIWWQQIVFIWKYKNRTFWIMDFNSCFTCSTYFFFLAMLVCYCWCGHLESLLVKLSKYDSVCFMIIDFFLNLYFRIWRKAYLSSTFAEPTLWIVFSLYFITFHNKTQITLDSGQFVLCLFLHRKSHKSLLLTWPYVFPCGNFEGPLCTLCTPVSQNNQWCHWVHQRYTKCQRFDKFWF